LSDHRFKVGQSVYVRQPGGVSGVYEIKQLLPSTGDEPHYRVKSHKEAHDRVAKESELSNAG
jgi:hypothetical protein